MLDKALTANVADIIAPFIFASLLFDSFIVFICFCPWAIISLETAICREISDCVIDG